jgi:hypothetical protein
LTIRHKYGILFAKRKFIDGIGGSICLRT